VGYPDARGTCQPEAPADHESGATMMNLYLSASDCARGWRVRVRLMVEVKLRL